MKHLFKRDWQDLVLSVAEIGFLLSLLPSVLGPDKPAAVTSLMTAVLLCGILVVNASKRWWYACSILSVTICVWLAMFVQVAF